MPHEKDEWVMNEVVKRCSSCLGFYEVTRKRCDCGYIEPERGPRCFETVAHFHLLPFEDAATRAQIAEWDARVPAGEDHEIIDTAYWKKTQSAPYEDDENVATAHKLIFPHGAICVGKERPPAWKCETPRLPKHDDKVYDEPQTFEDVEDRDAKEWDVPVGAGATPASFGKRRAKVRNWKNWQRFLRPVLEVPGFQRWTLRTPHRPLHISAEPAIEIENRQRHAAMRWEANERAYIMEDLIAREWSAKDLAADPYTSLATIYNIQYETPEPQYPVDRLALIVAAGGGYSKAERLNDARWVDGRGVGDSSGKSIDKRWV